MGHTGAENTEQVKVRNQEIQELTRVNAKPRRGETGGGSSLSEDAGGQGRDPLKYPSCRVLPDQQKQDGPHNWQGAAQIKMPLVQMMIIIIIISILRP